MNYFELQFFIFAWAERPAATKYDNFWINMLFDWQTMVAAIVAGVPAAFGAYLLWKQVSSQREETTRIREKEEVSARIRLVAALSALTSYYKTSVGPLMDSNYRTTEVPNASLETLMASAPVVDGEVFNHIKKVIIDFQIFSVLYPSRTGSIDTPMRDRALVLLAKLHKATNELYAYARFQAETVISTQETEEELSNSLEGLLAVSEPRSNFRDDTAKIQRVMRSHFRQTSTTVPAVEV